jgi:hypothetical protein
VRITTRDLLAKTLVEALENPTAAAVLHCLAAYCQTVRQTPLSMAVERFLQPAPETERRRLLALLEKNPLLSWDSQGGAGSVALSTAFASEWPEIVTKLIRYGAALAEWTPDETASAQANALRKGVLLFNHRLFFEVHEVLEAQWVNETGEEKRFFQGLIQIAVAFYHLGNNNLRGALSLLQDGMAKIAPHQPAFLGVEIHDFLIDVQTCHTKLQQLGPEGSRSFPAEKIPRLRFLDELVAASA